MSDEPEEERRFHNIEMTWEEPNGVMHKVVRRVDDRTLNAMVEPSLQIRQTLRECTFQLTHLLHASRVRAAKARRL